MSQPWLLTLDEINPTDIQKVGAKALHLSVLQRKKLATANALVVITAVLEHQINQYSLRPIWEGSPNVSVTEDALNFLADYLKTKPLVPDFEHALQRKLDELFPASVKSFAVRSSAIDEDGKRLSFAGLHLTELAVPRALIPVSITRVWASALTGEALQYRLKNDIPIQSIKIAVLIQPMLKPESAGVASTLNPISGARDEIVIEAVSTLGDAVARGTISPHRYHLKKQNPHYPVIQQSFGDEKSKAKEPLDDEKRQLLAQTLERIEALMGEPQDVEWLFAKNTLHILQTRSISAFALNDTFADTDHPNGDIDAEWTRANYPETLPELPSVQFASLIARTQRQGLQFFTQMGIDVSGLGPYIKTFYGRPYVNLSITKRVLTQLGLNPIPLLAMAGYVNATTFSNPFYMDWGKIWHAKKTYWNFLKQIFGAAHNVKTYVKFADYVVETLGKIPATADDARTQFAFRERLYGDTIGVGLILLSALTGLTVLVARLVLPFAESSTDVFQKLGTFGKNPAARRYNLSMWQLSRTALTSASVVAYLTRSLSYKNYEEALAGTDFLTAFQDYLAKDGYQSTYPADMGFPRYAEKPDSLLQVIAGYTRLSHKQSSDDAGKEIHPVWKMWRTLTANAKGMHRWFPWRKMLALPMLKLLYHVFSLRTDMFAAQTRAMAAIRRWDLALAEKWAATQIINAPDDYFWLTMEEVERVLVSASHTLSPLQPIIAARRESYAAYREMDVPLVLKDSEEPILVTEEGVEKIALEDTLVGLSVSAGQVQGRVSFLSDYDALEDVPEGHILVVPSTDPAYFPYFPLAVGLIVERGGMLSHGSIIAREYGLPAVSNIDARQQLHAGDRVLLDGSTGVVQVLERAK